MDTTMLIGPLIVRQANRHTHEQTNVTLHPRVKNYTCLRNTTHRRIYVSTYIAFLRVVMLNFLRGPTHTQVNSDHPL